MARYKLDMRPVPRLEKLTKRELEDLIFDLVTAFSLIKSPVEAASFTQDLLTESEVKMLAKRLRIAKLLLSGYKYREVVEELHVSLATVAKVGVWLKSAGEGFKKILARLPEKERWDSEDLSDWDDFKARYAAYFPFDEVNLRRARLESQKEFEAKLRKALSKLPRKSAILKEIKEIFADEYRAKAEGKRRAHSLRVLARGPSGSGSGRKKKEA